MNLRSVQNAWRLQLAITSEWWGSKGPGHDEIGAVQGLNTGLDPAIHAISYPPLLRSFRVTILASMKRGTLSIGVTNDVARAPQQLRRPLPRLPLVHVEEFATACEAIRPREGAEDVPPGLVGPAPSPC